MEVYLLVGTHCERFSLAPTRHKAEALRLNRHSSALDVLFYIPDKSKKDAGTKQLFDALMEICPLSNNKKKFKPQYSVKSIN